MTSTILDKSFLNDILNKPTEKFYKNYDRFNKYLKTDVVHLLKAKLLAHRITGNGSDKEAILIYKHENKYILLEIAEGTCELCFEHIKDYDLLIDKAIEQSYVTTSFNDVIKYYHNKVVTINEEDFHFGNTYFMSYEDTIKNYRKQIMEKYGNDFEF